jgi:hypothetical protein
MSNNKQRFRLPIRFSLRSMFIFLFLTSACFGILWQNWWIPWQSQRQGVELIDSRYGMGGIEFGDYQYESMESFPPWKRTLANWFGKDSVTRVTTAFSDGTGELIDISCWHKLPCVEKVRFDRAIIEDLAPIANFKCLKEFTVFQAGDATPPGKSGLEVLGTCPNLESIRLTSSGFPMSDDTLNSICNATKIKELEFDPWNCSSLKSLARLRELEQLKIWLTRPQYAADLDTIGDLSNLKELSIWVSSRCETEHDFHFLGRLANLKSCQIDADLTAEQEDEIRKSLPADCKVSFD